jgi:DNA-directed RNA polymerase specialized sigma24 family protein
MASEKVRAIEEYINENQPASNAEIKLHFGDDYSYSEIKMVQQFMSYAL